VYCHLDSILPEIQVGARVKRGQWVGMLGRRGGSGNFSHLHVGIYLSESDMIAGRMNRNINLYPWLVAAYLESSGAQLCSVARPHHAVRTGETVILDGSSSLAAGAPITSYEWVFHDGSRSRGPRAEKVYDRPGTYQAALWVESGRGARDVDFATVRVFSRDRPEGVMPTLFATFTPAGGIRAGDPVSFRLWPQGMEMGSIRIDFGDGTVLDGCRPYSAVAHIFRRPGVHVVTATASAAGLPVEQKLAVVVAGD
ncbi:MAG: PKD domain-containing protein, partial [Planctomycetes bacterium]|nr:PKD domain-containing protein [Planctomycetota bacterium]